jgi:LPS export ABC transporter protein LptC
LKPRNLLLVLAVAIAVILLVVISKRYRPEDQLQAVIKALPEGIDVSLEEIDYTHIEGGVARWRLVAHEVTRQADTQIMLVKNPLLEFFNDQGTPDGELQASTGKISDDYQQVDLKGDVVLKRADGYTLYTDRLEYDHKKQVAKTNAPVRLVSDKMTMNGTGMTYRVAKRRLVLNSAVNGIIDAD